MKRAVTGFLISIVVCTSCIGQIITSSEQAEQVLRKGKTQQVTGIIISSVGLAGLILGVNSFKEPNLSTLTDNLKATLVTAAGIGASIVGIVYLTSGNKKIKKANLFLNSEYLGITPEYNSRERIVSVGIKLNF